MKEIFINETKYSKKEYKMFLKVHQEQYGLKEDIYTIVYAILFIWFIIYSLKNHFYLPSIILTFVLLTFLAYRIIQPNITIKKETKSNMIKNEEINTYKFCKYYFNVKNKKADVNISYLKIRKVIETKTHFYVYLSKSSAYVVSKQGFIKGTSEEFSKFIRIKAFFRYKNKKSNS